MLLLYALWELSLGDLDFTLCIVRDISPSKKWSNFVRINNESNEFDVVLSPNETKLTKTSKKITGTLYLWWYFAHKSCSAKSEISTLNIVITMS